MSRRVLCAVVTAVALAGCGDSRDPTPTAPDLKPTPPPGTSCNYTSVKSFAKSLFGASSAEATLAQNMSAQPAGSEAATVIAFDIFAAIASKRDAAPSAFTTENASDGANLTLQTIACANVIASGDKTFAAFNASLSSGGGYEVRGGTEAADVSLDLTTVRSTPVFSGVRPPAGQGFAAWLGSRTLFYGRQITTFSTEATGGRAYDWSVVRRPVGGAVPVLGAPALVAVCVESADASTDATFRVQHSFTILPQTSAFDPGCPSTLPAFPPVASAGWSSRMFAARMMGLLAPTQLHAASLVRTGSPTGNAGSFTPFEAVIPGGALLTFQNQPADARANQLIKAKSGGSIQVKATGEGETAWQGVTILIFGTNNNGTPVTFTGNQATTEADGIATFPNLSVNKTGAYKLVAVTIKIDNQVTTFTSDQVSSNKFNVRP